MHNQVFLLSFFIGILFLGACNEEKLSINPTLRDMTISVYASAIVQPKNHYLLFPEVNGIINKLEVTEGDTLIENDIIAYIKPLRENYDVKSFELQRQLAESKLKGESNQLSLIESEIKNLKAQCITDSINYSRLKNLWEKNIGSKAELDNTKLKYEICIENLLSSGERKKQLEIELKNQLKQTQINVQRSQSLLQDYIVKVKGDSKVYKLNKEEGEMISRQEALAELGHKSEFIVEMQIDEIDIAKIELGQKTIVSLDAYPNQTYKANIIKVYPSKNLRNLSFQVEAQFLTRPEKLYAGLSGEANIIIEQKTNVLTIPLEYLDNENKVTDINNKKHVVQVGQKNIELVEIISGIDSSTQLIKP